MGAASRDLVDDDARGWRLGGAATFGGLTLARLGLEVRVLLGVDAEAGAATELEWLRAAGAELRLVSLRRGPVFVNRERPGGRDQVAIEACDAIPVTALPAEWRTAAAMLLAPIASELDPAWSEIAAANAVVALGWQGLLRKVVAGELVTRRPPAGSALLSRADLVGVSIDDLPPDVRLATLVDLIPPGATLVVTRADRGGTSLTSRRPGRSTLRAYPAIPADEVVDPTGAGDVFLAALLAATVDAARLDAPDWPARLAFAAAAASLSVEQPGLAGVPALDAVRRRAAQVA